MADRTVRYVFTGSFTNLTAGLAAGGKAVGDFGTKLTALDKNGAKMRAGLTTLGTSAGKFGLVAAGGLALVVGAAAKFDKAMSGVSAATRATTGELADLREAAIKAGADTIFSASEAADAITELAKAGVGTADILGGGLKGALDLAAAGQMGVADAAGIASVAMTQFKLSGEDVGHIADLLASGAGHALGSVQDLGAALNQGGLVASQMGVSIEETTGALAAFASAGMIGSDAGTSLKTMLLRLANPSAEAAATMKDLGIQAYDAQGNFVGLESLSGQLQSAFVGQSQASRDAALATIFGSDAIRGANVLYKEGAAGIANWTSTVDDAGYAADQAARLTDNLAGDIEQLKGSLETALIGSGEGAQGPLRSLVQDLTKVINLFNDAPPAIQGTVAKMLALTAVTGGGLWFGSKVVNGIVNTRTALDQLTGSSARSAKALSGLKAAGAIGAVVLGTSIAFDALHAAMARSLPGVESMTQALLNLGDAQSAQLLAQSLGDLGSALDNIDGSGFADGINDLYRGIPLVGDTAQKLAQGIPILGASLYDADQKAQDTAASISALDGAMANIVASGSPEQAASAFADLAKMYGLSSDQQKQLLSLMPQYKEALAGVANSADLAAGATGDYGVSNRQSATAAETNAAAIENLTKAMKDQRSAALAAFDAETQWGQALADARKMADRAKDGIDPLTKAGRENRNALSQLASAWNNQSDAVKNTEGRFKSARQAFIDTATDMNVPQRAAEKLADKLLEIPPKRYTKITVDGGEALRVTDAVLAKLAKIVSKTITITAHTVGNATGGLFDQGGYTGGGGVHEPAGIVHRGEVVIPQREVKRDWSMLKSRYGHLPGMATGGLAGSGLSTYARTPETAAANNAADALDKVADKAKRAAIGFEWVSGGMVAELKVRQRLLEHEVDRDKQRLDMLKQERQALADSIAARFSDSPFGQGPGQQDVSSQMGQNYSAPGATLPDGTTGMSDREFNLWWMAQQQAHNAQIAAENSPTAILQQQLADAREMRNLLQQLQRMGLSGPALAQVATTASLEEMRALLDSGRGGIRQYEQLLGQVGQVSSQIGSSVGNAVYGADIKEQTKVLHESREHLKHLNERVEKLEKSNKIGHHQTKAAVDHLAGKVGNAKR